MSATRRYLLRLAVALALLAYAAVQFDLGSALAQLSGANLLLLSCALALYYIDATLCALRWKTLLRTLGKRLPLGKLATRYIEAGFFNLFVPGFVAGDVARAVASAGGSRPGAADLLGVALDRFWGLLFTLAFVAVAFMLGAYEPLGQLWRGVLLAAFAAGAAALLFVITAGRKLAAGKAPAGARLARLVETMHGAQRVLRSSPASVAGVALTSIGFVLGTILVELLLSRALGLQIPFWVLAAFGPLGSLLMSIPISIGGIGVRENLFVFLYGSVGIASPDALAFALSISALQLVGNLGGGVLFALRAWVRPRSKAQLAEAQSRGA